MSAFNTSPGLVVTPSAAGAGAAVLSAGYLTGLQMWKTGDTTLVVAAGGARDSANALDLVLAVAQAVDFSAVGINGADVDIANADAIVYAYVVGGDAVSTGILISASPLAPVLPVGYTAHRFVGSIPITAGEGPFQIDWMQQGHGRTRVVRLGPQEPQVALVGGPWPTTPVQIPGVTGSVSWRNIVAGGTDVQFDPLERVPARPIGAGGNNARRGIRVIFLFITRTNTNDFLEVAPAHGALEVPTSSPLNGDSNVRAYNIASNQTVELALQVGDGQMIQYRSSIAGNTYLIAVVGWHDEL